MKKCSGVGGCGLDKNIDDFYRQKGGRDGRRTICKSCCNVRYEVESPTRKLYNQSPSRKLSKKISNQKYEKSEKGKQAQKRKNSSLSSLQSQKNFRESPEGRESQWRRSLRFCYGIEPEVYHEMLRDQEGSCKICKSINPGRGNRHFSVDHNHTSGIIRGLLCYSCNMGLSKFKDDSDLLSYAADMIDQGSSWWSELSKTSTPPTTYKSGSKDYKSNHWLNRKYGITLQDYNRRLEAQDGKCGFCCVLPGHKRLAVDHCHKESEVRRLLCDDCNSGMGFFQEDSKILRSAAKYLSK